MGQLGKTLPWLKRHTIPVKVSTIFFPEIITLLTYCFASYVYKCFRLLFLTWLCHD